MFAKSLRESCESNRAESKSALADRTEAARERKYELAVQRLVKETEDEFRQLIRNRHNPENSRRPSTAELSRYVHKNSSDQ